MLLASEIVHKMMNQDWMSQWLGIQIISIEKGNVVLKMTVRKEMLNGFSIAHGGITYSLSDTCLAFSSNSYGEQAVSIETSISHLKPVFEGDILTTEVKEISITKKFGIYQVNIFNQKNEMVSVFKGTMYKNGKIWE